MEASHQPGLIFGSVDLVLTGSARFRHGVESNVFQPFELAEIDDVNDVLITGIAVAIDPYALYGIPAGQLPDPLMEGFVVHRLEGSIGVQVGLSLPIDSDDENIRRLLLRKCGGGGGEFKWKLFFPALHGGGDEEVDDDDEHDVDHRDQHDLEWFLFCLLDTHRGGLFGFHQPSRKEASHLLLKPSSETSSAMLEEVVSGEEGDGHGDAQARCDEGFGNASSQL